MVVDWGYCLDDRKGLKMVEYLGLKMEIRLEVLWDGHLVVLRGMKMARK